MFRNKQPEQALFGSSMSAPVVDPATEFSYKLSAHLPFKKFEGNWRKCFVDASDSGRNQRLSETALKPHQYWKAWKTQNGRGSIGPVRHHRRSDQK
jgi:hypothetical protein